LDHLVGEFTADETFLTTLDAKPDAKRTTYDVEDGALGIGRILILCGITNQTFFIGEGDPRRCYTVTLVVDKNFDYLKLVVAMIDSGCAHLFRSSLHPRRNTWYQDLFQLLCAIS